MTREQEQHRVVIQVLAGVALQLGNCFSKAGQRLPRHIEAEHVPLLPWLYARIRQ
jgi:hypothetical protein